MTPLGFHLGDRGMPFEFKDKDPWDGYTKLTALVGTGRGASGTGTISLDVAGTADFSVDVTFGTSPVWVAVCGFYDSSKITYSQIFGIAIGGSIQFRPFEGRSVDISSYRGNRTEFEFKHDGGAFQVWTGGAKIGEESGYGIVPTNEPFGIFPRTSTYNDGCPNSCKFYGAKSELWEICPAMRNSDGAIGALDIVSGKFATISSGTINYEP